MPATIPAEQAASNSLGLDLEALKIKDDPKPAAGSADNASQHDDGTDEKTDDAPESPSAAGKKESKEKKKPYVNPDRVNTGGARRDRLSKEELEERMARIREQNEKIKQRRLDVQADEEVYREQQEAERVKNAKTRKIQESVNKARQDSALRKLDKVQSREWDSGKPAPRESKRDEEKNPSGGLRGAVRGGSRGGARGRGRGRGQVTSPTAEKPTNNKTTGAGEDGGEHASGSNDALPAPTPPSTETVW